MLIEKIILKDLKEQVSNYKDMIRKFFVCSLLCKKVSLIILLLQFFTVSRIFGIFSLFFILVVAYLDCKYLSLERAKILQLNRILSSRLETPEEKEINRLKLRSVFFSFSIFPYYSILFIFSILINIISIIV